MFNKGNFNYITSFPILSFGDSQIELLENYIATDKIDLRLREGFYISTLPNVVNKLIAGRTQRQSQTAYANRRNLIDNVCQCGGTYKYSSKSTHNKTKRHLKHFLKT
jgi:hypothetical protein